MWHQGAPRHPRHASLSSGKTTINYSYIMSYIKSILLNRTSIALGRSYIYMDGVDTVRPRPMQKTVWRVGVDFEEILSHFKPAAEKPISHVVDESENK